MDRLLADIRELDTAQEHDVAWASRLQDLCETIWPMLDDQVSADCLDAFVHLLSRVDAYETAQLVLPDLRVDHTSSPSATTQSKRYVVECTKHMRARAIVNHDTASYRSEKEILAQAELYRAMVAFENTCPMSQEEKAAFKQWWDSNPVNKRKRLPEEQVGESTVEH